MSTSPAVALPHWEWRRNCALTPRQTLLGLAVLGAPCLGVGVMFWVMGYPWVAFFSALELAAVAMALRCYARHACDRETLTLHPGRLVVEQHDGDRARRTEFDSAWVRVQAPARAADLLLLTQCGRRLAVGRHLRPCLRARAVRELRGALAGAAAQPASTTSRARNTPPDPFLSLETVSNA